MPQNEASDDVPATRLPQEREPAAPFWARVPRGWIVLLLFVLAWGGIYLIWNGVKLVLHL